MEEFLCAKITPLTRGFDWFSVRDDAKYAVRGLKFLRLDLKSSWSGVTSKARTHAEGASRVVGIVKRKCEDLVGPLEPAELKRIKKFVNSRRRINRCFDLLGATYDDYPSVDASGSEGGPKRKPGSTGGREPGRGKRGRGSSHGRGSTNDRAVVAKVPKRQSTNKVKVSASAARAPAQPAAGGVVIAPSASGSASGAAGRWTRIVLGLHTLPVVDVESGEEDEDEDGESDSDDEQSGRAASSSERAPSGDVDVESGDDARVAE